VAKLTVPRCSEKEISRDEGGSIGLGVGFPIGGEYYSRGKKDSFES